MHCTVFPMEWVSEPDGPDAALLRLAGGLRVLVMPVEGAEVCHVHLVMNTGQDHETDPADREVAHFVEHLQGCWTSDENPSAERLALESASRGCDSNASVTADTTTYWLTCQPKDLSHFTRVLLRSLTHFRLDGAVFEQERSAVKEELRGILADPWTELHHRVLAAQFGDHPRACHTRDQLANMDSIGPDRVEAYRRAHYRAGGAVLALAGRLTEPELTRALAVVRGHLPPPGAIPPFPPPAPPGQPRDLRVTLEGTGTAHRVQVWWRTGLLAQSPESLALRVAMLVLTGGFHSRLYRALRTRLGLVYYVSGSVDSQDGDTSLSRAHLATECAAEAVPRVVPELLRAVEELARDGPDPEELRRARNGLRLTQLRARQDRACPETHAAAYAYSLLKYGEVRGLTREAEMLRGVTAAQVAAAAAALGEPMVACGGEDAEQLRDPKSIAGST